jgi:pimeloyl-ACP methyl ester carboxylesterase
MTRGGAGNQAHRGWPPATLALLLCCAAMVNAQSRFAPFAGGRVHYESYGEGTEALVFIHGWTCDLTFWRAQAPLYEQRRSLLIDLPGHGESDKPDVPYPSEYFARGIEAAMRDAGVQRAVLVGHSLGGPIAYAFLRLYPRQVQALVLVDASISPTRDTAASRKAQAARYAANRKSLSGAAGAAHFATRIEGMFSIHTPEDMREQIRARMLATPEHVRVAAVTSASGLKAVKSPETYSLPALAILAAPSGPDGRGASLRKLFPHIRVESWNGAGHFLMMEDPERFNRTLELFLAALPQ